MSLQGACGGLTIIACDDVAILDEGVFQGEAAAINFTGVAVTATVLDGVATVNIVGGGGSSAFNDITSGTNTTATMVVDTGASLSFSGSGTIAATSATLATTANNISTANLTTDSTCFPVFVTASGTQASLPALTNSTFGYDSTNNTLSVTNLSATNISGALTGNASTATALQNARTIGGVSFDGTANIVPATITVADTTDTTCFVGLWESATGDLAPKSDGGLTYNATTGALTATGFVGPLTGNVTGNVNGVTLTAAVSATDFLNAAGSYVAAGGGGTPGGASGTIQYNNAGAFGGAGTIDASANVGLGTVAAGVTTITAADTNALTVGPSGATNPTLQVSTNTASAATGIRVFGRAAGAGTTIFTISSGTNEALTMSAKGTGILTLGSTSGGAIRLDMANSTGLAIRGGGTNRYSLTDTSATITPTTDSAAATPRFSFTGAANTALTNTTEFTQVYFNMGQTNQHASNGTVTLQRDMRISGMTHTAASATKTFTDTAVLAIDGYAQAGTNSQITNGHGLYIPTQAVAGTVANAYGITVAAPTGAGTINAAINCAGNLLMPSGDLGITGTRVTKGWFTDIESTNAPTIGGTSATGTGGLVLANTPTLVTPVIGAATGTSLALSGVISFTENQIDATPNTDDTVNGDTTSTFNAGATIAQWDLVYLGSSSTWLLADADASSTAGPVMLALSAQAQTAGNAMKVALPGSFCRNDAWAWTPGAALYVDTTAGGITATAPSATGDIVRVIGYATTADTLYFMPSGAWVEVA
jgi:hypothetical protein